MQEAEFDRGEARDHFMAMSTSCNGGRALRCMTTTLERIERRAIAEIQATTMHQAIQTESTTSIGRSPTTRTN